MKKGGRVIVIGGGLGGLWATLKVAEAGLQVDLFSLFEVKRSHSVCAQGGINAVFDVKGEHDSIRQHIVDTVKGGSYIANQPPIKAMCEGAPGLIHTFERMGVAFSRTPEGIMDQRLFGGVRKRRTCFAGASTGQQLMYGVDEQVRRLESLGRVTKYEWWEFLAPVLDRQGVCKGVVAMDLRSHELRSFRADAVIIASGGMGLVFGRSTNSTNSTGAAAARVWRAGARMANLEFFQFHPTAMLGQDKTRLMSEAARGEGGRVWVPKNPGDPRRPRDIPEAGRFYFLEEWYPRYGNTVPRDVASRAIWKVVRDMDMGVNGEDKVYLDLSHLDSTFVRTRLGAILDIYSKFTGVDPTVDPMEIFPAPHYSMGGIWVDYERNADGGLIDASPRNHATSIPGLYACGECDYAYHGANRLGANSLLSTSFSGRVTGEAVVSYLQGLEHGCDNTPEECYSEIAATQQTINEKLLAGCGSGNDNVYQLHHVLGELMTSACGVVRNNARIDQRLEEIKALRERFAGVDIAECGNWANQGVMYARQLGDMIELGAGMLAAARARDECRGSHYKPAFDLAIPENSYPGDPAFEAYRRRWKENNQAWLKTTLVDWNGGNPQIGFEDVDTSIVPPEEPRDYR